MSTLSAAAGSGVLHTVGGQTLEVRPLNLKDYGTLELCALKDWKKKRIESYAQILDYLPAEERKPLLLKAAEENAKLDESDLPTKTQMFDGDGNVTLDEAECVKKRKIPYVQWWSAMTHEGRISSVWLSLRKAQPQLTLEDVEQLVGDEPHALVELANAVGEVSQSSLGPPGNPPAAT